MSTSILYVTAQAELNTKYNESEARINMVRASLMLSIKKRYQDLRLGCSLLFNQICNSLTYSGNILGFLIRNFATKFFFKGHNQLN